MFKTLGEWSTDLETALEYLKQASEQDEGNVEILYALLQRYVASGKEEEARSIIQKAITEKIAGMGSTLLIAMLKTAVSKQNESDLLSIFKAIFSLISSSPEWWTVLQHEMEASIENARTENKYDELSILLLQLGSAVYYLRRDSPEQVASAAGHWRECLDMIREKVLLEDQERLDFIKQSALVHLSMFHFQAAMQTDGEENVEKLRQIYADDPASPGPKSMLASFYTFKGKRDKARDIFRPDMVQAFNILSDDDMSNDGEGFGALRNLLNHTGDYENSLRAAFLLPTWRFDDEVLKELLAGEEPSLEAASAELLRFYQTECSRDNKMAYNFRKTWDEAKRLASEAKEGSETATCYNKVVKIFDQIEDGFTSWHFSCNNCVRLWDYDNGLHICKYCYDMELCDNCWNELQSGDAGKGLACSKTHDWWEVQPWTTEKYVHFCKRLIPVKADDGSQELISPSKWLGDLCEEWGLSKTDWNFD